ncbi:TIGR04255 family protein [Paucibacter sp. M5-1]|uniref:TIGR04255 family protein n=1 Tax=Paucibacter sp. M5-1 TaxID=3015998 RepID=UPI0022B8871E|nr:TIGR04255 family protein [Paucibacter sp. M5-1]MCZ7880347.1 TIGR04255 family protein [Paucibacter sp. M5-1]
MNPTWEADTLVAVRSKNVDRYKRNYLRQAVCELRFPTLMELGAARPPEKFVTALRKDYPYLELQNEVTLALGSVSSGSNSTHVFRSAKLNWTVSLKESAVSIETTAYTEYAQMREKVLRVVDAATKVIDSDFFTRVGLRYINVIEGTDDPRNGWVNHQLVAPIVGTNFKGIGEYAGKLQLVAGDGGCLLQHGIRVSRQQKDASIHPEYMLDVDVFRNEVAVDDVSAALDVMHSQAFDVFDWSLGEKAREYLSSAGKSTKG